MPPTSAATTTTSLTGRQILNRVLLFTVVKVGLLVGLYMLFFSPPHRSVVTPGSVEATLFTQPRKDGGAP